MKQYSFKVIRIKTKQESMATFDTLDQLVVFKNDMIYKINTDSRSKGESFQLISKRHNDNAFNYDIIESVTLDIK